MSKETAFPRVPNIPGEVMPVGIFKNPQNLLFGARALQVGTAIAAVDAGNKGSVDLSNAMLQAKLQEMNGEQAEKTAEKIARSNRWVSDTEPDLSWLTGKKTSNVA